MEITLVKSLHIGDPDMISPVYSEYPELQVPDVLAAGRCLADALQVLFGLHPSPVHVCSCNTCTGGSMLQTFSLVAHPYVAVPNCNYQAFRMALFWSACLPLRKAGFDSCKSRDL